MQTRDAVDSCAAVDSLKVLKARINGLTFKSKHAEHALVHAAKRFSADKSLQGFNPKSELTQGQGPLC